MTNKGNDTFIVMLLIFSLARIFSLHSTHDSATIQNFFSVSTWRLRESNRKLLQVNVNLFERINWKMKSFFQLLLVSFVCFFLFLTLRKKNVNEYYVLNKNYARYDKCKRSDCRLYQLNTPRKHLYECIFLHILPF